MKRTKHVHLRVYLFLHSDVKSLQLWNHIWSKICPCAGFTLDPHKSNTRHKTPPFGSSKPPMMANCWRKQHVTQYFFGFPKYFSGFRDNSWIWKLVWNLENNASRFNNFIKICNTFSDFINSPTMISKQHYDLIYFFGF